jgi:hypothetical protein
VFFSIIRVKSATVGKSSISNQLNKSGKIKEAPPPYTESPNALPAAALTKSSNTVGFSTASKQRSGAQTKPTAQPATQTNRRLPKDFGFYHGSGSMSDIVIALKADDINLIFYISTHGGFSRKPSAVVHSGRYQTLTPIATADFPSFTSTITIDIKASTSYSAERYS